MGRTTGADDMARVMPVVIRIDPAISSQVLIIFQHVSVALSGMVCSFYPKLYILSIPFVIKSLIVHVAAFS